jgi:hypothetical protein
MFNSRYFAPAEHFSCQNCGASVVTETFLTCGKCNTAIYCSSVCQTAHFLEHRGICDCICQDLSNDTFRSLDCWISGKKEFLDEIAWRLLREKLESHLLILPIQCLKGFYPYRNFRINKFLGDTFDIVPVDGLLSVAFFRKISEDKLSKVSRGCRSRATVVFVVNLTFSYCYEINFSHLFADAFDLLLGYEKTISATLPLSEPTLDDLVAKVNSF